MKTMQNETMSALGVDCPRQTPAADRITEGCKDVEAAIDGLYIMFEKVTNGNLPRDSAKVAEVNPQAILSEVLIQTPESLHQYARRLNELRDMMTDLLL